MRWVVGMLACLWTAGSLPAGRPAASRQAAGEPAGWQPAVLWRDTNSYAAAKHGLADYKAKKYIDATRSFRTANEIAPTPRNAFNLGTSEIAAGNREEGSATLSRALADPAFRASALFNRGNSALSSNAYDHAIRDYSDALRAKPDHAAAKRNLEIALARKAASQQSRAGSQNNPKGGSPQPQPSQRPAARSGQKDEQRGDPSAEALLRSVQQQEQEEMTRMRQMRPEPRRIGW